MQPSAGQMPDDIFFRHINREYTGPKENGKGGKMRKRIWLANGDIILVSLREFEPEKCDVVEKYKEKEVAKLKNAGEIPDSFVLPTGGEEGNLLFEEQEVVTEKKKEGSTGFEIDSESEEEKENEEEDKKEEDKKEDKKEEDKEKEKEMEEQMAKEKEKKSKRDKKEKDKKRKNNRDKKRGDKGEDEGGFNIDDI